MLQRPRYRRIGDMRSGWYLVSSMLAAASYGPSMEYSGSADCLLGEYLDVVYGAHDQGMIFVAIMWAVLLALFFGYGIGWRLIPSRQSAPFKSEGESESSSRSHQRPSHRLANSFSASLRHYLLPNTFLRSIFGRVTRLQVLILTILSMYLTIFTFVGYTYKTWVTPVKNMEGVYNTRTSLGPFSDRIGVLAYALLPLSVLLATRESLLSLLTGIPYQNFQPLHRWIGYIIFVQSAVHTIGWSVVEGRLYQPQPKVWNAWIRQLYMIWGTIAMVLLTIMLVMSFSCSVRLTGYEVFRKAHYLLAVVFLGACYGHWEQLGCFLIASLVVWFLDRIARLLRTFLLHYQYLPDGSGMRFQTAQAKVTYFPDETNGDVVRLDFVHNHAAWEVGQHFYLCFPECSFWQSHPFTPLSLPGLNKEGQQHTYVFRAKSGETRKMAEIAMRKCRDKASTEPPSKAKEISMLPSSLQSQPRTPTPTTSVVLQGPYGRGHVDELTQSPDINALLVAGGSGITFVLPVLYHLMTAPVPTGQGKDRKITLIWAVRRRQDIKWVQKELDILNAAAKRMNLTIRIFVTREDKQTKLANSAKPSCCGGDNIKDITDVEVQEKMQSSSSSSSGDDIQEIGNTSSSSSSPPRRLSIQQASPAETLDPEARHPDLAAIVTNFVASTVCGPTIVYASGPGGLIADLRDVVAQCSSGSKVWKGDERGDVRLVCDDRVEY